MIPIQKETEMSAAILAGGENSRFNGKIKANIQIHGVRIITKITKILHEIFDEVIIVTNTPEEFKSYHKYKIVPDVYKKVGPLGGIHAAMNASDHDNLFVVASDMPCVSTEIIRAQAKYFKQSNGDVLIPKISNFIEPLHGIYSKSIFDKLDEYLKNPSELRIRDFLEQVKVKYFYLEDDEHTRKAFANINTPGDLQEIQMLAEIL